MKVVKLLMTAIIGGIFHKQCQWLAWRVWLHALAFGSHEITWRRSYVALLSPLPWRIYEILRQNPHSHFYNLKQHAYVFLKLYAQYSVRSI